MPLYFLQVFKSQRLRPCHLKFRGIPKLTHKEINERTCFWSEVALSCKHDCDVGTRWRIFRQNMDQFTRLEFLVRHVTGQPRDTDPSKRCAIDNVSAVSLKTSLCLKTLVIEWLGVVPGVPLAISSNPKAIMLSQFFETLGGSAPFQIGR